MPTVVERFQLDHASPHQLLVQCAERLGAAARPASTRGQRASPPLLLPAESWRGYGPEGPSAVHLERLAGAARDVGRRRIGACAGRTSRSPSRHVGEEGVVWATAEAALHGTSSSPAPIITWPASGDRPAMNRRWWSCRIRWAEQRHERPDEARSWRRPPGTAAYRLAIRAAPLRHLRAAHRRIHCPPAR